MLQEWKIYLAVFLGGALGSVARYALAGWIAGKAGNAFPWGILAVNALGCFLMGWFYGITTLNGSLSISPALRAFLMIGLCGGFTTMSSFTLQTILLAMESRPSWALLNVGLSLGVGLILTWLGVMLSQWSK
ncbi:MAG: fluoride efflux transporter CrcB [Verrucomicrobia bacterium]|nr:MAG: fluoride efflux transporter CrcB [Verrucomicrobiota bacterium]